MSDLEIEELKKDRERLEFLIWMQNSNPYYAVMDQKFSRDDIDKAMREQRGGK